MQSCVVSISEIMKDPKHSLSAKEWCERKRTPEEENNFYSKLKDEVRELRNETK